MSDDENENYIAHQLRPHPQEFRDNRGGDRLSNLLMRLDQENIADQIDKLAVKASEIKIGRIECIRDIFVIALQRQSLTEDEIRTFFETEFYKLAKKAEQANVLSDIPIKALEEWKGMPTRKSENPIAFIKRLYSEWLIPGGLNQADIKRLHRDDGLYMAMHNWLRHHDMPDDVYLPSKPQALTEAVERLGPEGVKRALAIGLKGYRP